MTYKCMSLTLPPNLPSNRWHAVKQLTDFIDDVVTLMSSRKLKLNGIKAGFLVVFSPQQLLKKYGRPDNIVVDGAVY